MNSEKFKDFHGFFKDKIHENILKSCEKYRQNERNTKISQKFFVKIPSKSEFFQRDMMKVLLQMWKISVKLKNINKM